MRHFPEGSLKPWPLDRRYPQVLSAFEVFPSHVRAYGTCECGTAWQLILDIESYRRWRAGTMVQDAFPLLSSDERELLLSGTCSTCWDNLMGEED
jgi:hypothetical protein